MSFSTVSGTTINSNADNRVITGSGTANTLNGESNLLFDGKNLGVGTSSPVAPVTINDKATFSFNVNDAVYGNNLYYDGAGNDRWERLSGNAGSAYYQTAGAHIWYRTAAGGATGDAVTPTESMRIDNSGNVGIGATGQLGGGWDAALNVTNNNNGAFFKSSGDSGYAVVGIQTGTYTSTTTAIVFYNGSGGTAGSISLASGNTATGVSYNTSSDYRLKENVVTDWDATTRLKQLRPSRFNFISDADTTVDGFLAHEVSDIVPEAITGEKDATETLSNVVLSSDNKVIAKDISEDDWTAGKTGDDAIYPSDSTWEASHTVPVYQGIDQSKLVPLLVKTIQELEARITTLENA